MVNIMNVTIKEIEIESPCWTASTLKIKRKRDAKKSSISAMRKKNIISINALSQLWQKI